MQLTEQEKRYIEECSIERILNTAITMAKACRNHERLAEDAGVNLQDLQDVKALATKIWNDTRNRIFTGEL